MFNNRNNSALKMEAAGSSKPLVTSYESTWCRNLENTIYTAVKSSNLINCTYNYNFRQHSVEVLDEDVGRFHRHMINIWPVSGDELIFTANKSLTP
jgi:hypothetical protein